MCSSTLCRLRARLLLAQGQVAPAAAWARERGLGEEDALSYPSEREYLVVAQVLLATDQAPRARRLLERLHAAAVAQERTGRIRPIRQRAEPGHQKVNHTATARAGTQSWHRADRAIACSGGHSYSHSTRQYSAGQEGTGWTTRPT